MIDAVRKKINEIGISNWVIESAIRFITWLFFVTVLVYILVGGWYGPGGFISLINGSPERFEAISFICIIVLLYMLYNKICQLTDLFKKYLETNQKDGSDGC